MTTAERITQLKKLINETHKHGQALEAEIKKLRAKHSIIKANVLAIRLGYLKALNKRREAELVHLEHLPKPQRFTM